MGLGSVIRLTSQICQELPSQETHFVAVLGTTAYIVSWLPQIYCFTVCPALLVESFQRLYTCLNY